MGVTQTTLDRLACPACHAALRLEGAAVRCAGCGRVFPVEDGLPVLLVERAKKS